MMSGFSMSPYEKLCITLIGAVPNNRRGKRTELAKEPTVKSLAQKIGVDTSTVLRWPLLHNTRVRVIPAARAGVIEKLSGGAVTADEVVAFAEEYKHRADKKNRY